MGESKPLIHGQRLAESNRSVPLRGEEMNEKTLQGLLLNWSGLNKFLRTASEADVAKMLEAEKKGRRRRTHLLRLHGTLNKLRAQREREELTDLAK